MDDADVLVTKINKWVCLQKECSRKLTNLASELEDAVKAANVTKVVGSSVSVGGAAAMTAAGVLTVLTGGVALPVLATMGAVGAVASGTSLLTSVGSEAYSASKSKDIMEEAKKVLDELKSLEEEMKKLMKSLKEKSCSSCDDDDNDDDDDGDILEMFMRSEARRHGINLSGSIRIRKVCDVRKFNISRRIMANQVMLAASGAIILQALVLAVREGGKKAASSVGKKAGSAALGCVAGGAVGLLFSVPELVNDCQNLDNNETEVSETLRENARAIRTSAQETEEELEKIREALQKLNRIKSIIEKKTRSHVEKGELIAHAIKNSPDPLVKEWLENNAESEDFFHLVDLWYFINQKLGEEWEKKNKKDRERRKIDLVFLAHGAIENFMIPARCLLPLPSITDVLLYPPWNCLLSAEAAYSIATGCIQPQDRQFGCSKQPGDCPFSTEDHVTFPLPRNWNSMRQSGAQLIPKIMVAPVGTANDKAFEYFIALENYFGSPAANRYLIPFLAPFIGRVPFFVVTLALSLVLFFSGFEATVHLAACLEKSPRRAMMEEELLRWQYAYTVDNTVMTVPLETFNSTVFNMFRAVFGDVVRSSNR
ncbi:uncharacterized protein LOC105923191 isoform X2 [Fundulus heteroclitus]|uniref:uncharacterized protein LOC105923191 isoform X2 n=1 Tax=Fundulus heteroclitus TaxID=8078 RepID=UPI00165CBBD6|nr:uncharacterized protein LOC105923191 isoform X2 [Fundulus heteroclitus]